MNTRAYLIYLLTTYLITVHVGLVFFRNGRRFILPLLEGDERLTDFINRALLTGYYLVNLGYAAIMLRTWKTVQTWPALVSGIGSMTGKIMITLALMHYCNMAALLWFSRRHRITHSKTHMT